MSPVVHEDAVRLVAARLPKDPVLFYRLAAVNTSFRAVFLSDSLWRHLDPNGWRTNIARRFLEQDAAELKEIKKQWRETDLEKTSREFDWLQMKNPYCKLACLAQSSSAGGPTENIQDRQLMWCAVHLNGFAFTFGNHELRRDLELGKAAVNSSPFVLSKLDDSLQNNRDVVLTAVKADGRAFNEARRQMYDDMEIAISAVRTNPSCFLRLSSNLKDNETVVSEAVRADPYNILFASQRCKQTLHVALEALVDNYLARQLVWQYCPDLRKHEEGMLRAIALCPRTMSKAAPRLHLNRRFIRRAIEANPMSFNFVKGRLRDDRELMAKATEAGCKIVPRNQTLALHRKYRGEENGRLVEVTAAHEWPVDGRHQ